MVVRPVNSKLPPERPLSCWPRLPSERQVLASRTTAVRVESTITPKNAPYGFDLSRVSRRQLVLFCFVKTPKVGLVNGGITHLWPIGARNGKSVSLPLGGGQRRSAPMCDYSLHNVKTRPAQVGDKVTTRLFKSGTRGFCAPQYKSVAVCVLPGTGIVLHAGR